MITIYKKIEKCANNPTGYVEIKDLDELNNPFLLCISAQDNNDKSIYGIIREGAEAARVYNTSSKSATFKIDKMPVDFLGVRYRQDNENSSKHKDIVDSFLYPFLMQNGKEDIEKIIQQARKMNFMTYCDGTETYKNIENLLEERLKSDNITDENIDAIISQISLVAIGTMVDTSELNSTTVTFIDVNDEEIETQHTEDFKNTLQLHQRNSLSGNLKNNNNLYIYNGTGNHDLKEYLNEDSLVKPVLSAVVSNFLENSLNNEVKSSIEPLKTYTDENVSSKDLLTKLDNELSYHNTLRYNEEELSLRKELDLSYKKLLKAQLQIEKADIENKKKTETLNLVTDNIKKYSSDVTYLQILASSGLWQLDENDNSLLLPSDKEVRDSYENNIIDDTIKRT